MDQNTLIVQILIIVAAVFFGILSGRAKAAHLRQLGDDLNKGRKSGYAIIAIVVAIIGYSFYSSLLKAGI